MSFSSGLIDLSPRSIIFALVFPSMKTKFVAIVLVFTGGLIIAFSPNVAHAQYKTTFTPPPTYVMPRYPMMQNNMATGNSAQLLLISQQLQAQQRNLLQMQQQITLLTNELRKKEEEIRRLRRLNNEN